MAYKSKKYEPSPSVDRDTLLRLSRNLLELDDEIARIKLDRKETSDLARDEGIHAQAHTLALRLAKMSPGKRALFLECFDDLRMKLALDENQTAVDDQSDLEDAIKRQAAA